MLLHKTWELFHGQQQQLASLQNLRDRLWHPKHHQALCWCWNCSKQICNIKIWHLLSHNSHEELYESAAASYLTVASDIKSTFLSSHGLSVHGLDKWCNLWAIKQYDMGISVAVTEYLPALWVIQIPFSVDKLFFFFFIPFIWHSTSSIIPKYSKYIASFLTPEIFFFKCATSWNLPCCSRPPWSHKMIFVLYFIVSLSICDMSLWKNQYVLGVEQVTVSDLKSLVKQNSRLFCR